jgi:hypothetical protein
MTTVLAMYALGRWKQEELEFQACLSYQKKKKKRQEGGKDDASPVLLYVNFTQIL